MKLLLFKSFKLILFVFNTFYFLIGIGFLILRAFIYLNPNQINELLKVEYAKEYNEWVYILIAFAIFSIIVGLIGCTGILNEKNWILFLYFSLLFTIFGLLFTASVYIYIKSVNYFEEFRNKILNAIRHKYGSSSVHSFALDYLQYNFKCCGWYSPKDWMDSSYTDQRYPLRKINNVITISPDFTYKIPHSCCVNNYDLTCVSMNKFHEVGCENIIRSYFRQIELYIVWIMTFLNLFQLILMILSLYLMFTLFILKKSGNKKDDTSSQMTESNIDTNDDDNNMFITSYYL